MIRSLIKRSLHRVLKTVYERHNGKPRSYRSHGIKLRIYPGVFHPGVFFSTNLLIAFLSDKDLKGKRVLELGAGSGLISFYLSRYKGAVVTASDISNAATEGLHYNAQATGINIKVLQSDLFENVRPEDYDWIIINPPYYNKTPQTEPEHAFYCGAEFEYFKRLFAGLSSVNKPSSQWIMILSEDCKLTEIGNLAHSSGLLMQEVQRIRKYGEWNMIYTLHQKMN